MLRERSPNRHLLLQGPLRPVCIGIPVPHVAGQSLCLDKVQHTRKRKQETYNPTPLFQCFYRWGTEFIAHPNQTQKRGWPLVDGQGATFSLSDQGFS